MLRKCVSYVSKCQLLCQLSPCVVAPCFQMTNKSEFSDYIKAKVCPSKEDFIRHYWFLAYCNVAASQQYFQFLIYLNDGHCCGNYNNLEFTLPLSFIDPIERFPMTQVTKITLIRHNCLDECWANPRIIIALSLTKAPPHYVVQVIIKWLSNVC